jgi:hypothetical protein
LTVHLPDGYLFERAAVGSENAKHANWDETATVRIAPLAVKEVEQKTPLAK